MMIWTKDYPIAKVTSGKWGDDYPSLRIVEPGIEAKVEAFMEQITYGEIAPEAAKTNAKRIVSCVNACSGIEDPTDLRKQRDELIEACKGITSKDFSEAHEIINFGPGGTSEEEEAEQLINIRMATIHSAVARCKPSGTEEK